MPHPELVVPAASTDAPQVIVEEADGGTRFLSVLVLSIIERAPSAQGRAA